MTALTDAVAAAIKTSRLEMEPDEHGSHHAIEVRVPIGEWSEVMRAWKEERTQEIAREGLKELREAIYGESK